MQIIQGLTHQNIFIRRNNTFSLDFQYQLPDNSIVNTTGYTGYWQFRPYKNSYEMFFEANTTNGMVTFSGVDGGIHILLNYTTTLNLPDFEKGVHELLVISPGTNGVAKSLLEGAVEIVKSSVFVGTTTTPPATLY